MSRYEFKLPDIGEGVAEGEVVAWHVKVGDEVKEDQLLVEIMTDKATVTIASPRTGRIASLGADKGQVVKVHAVLVVFELGEGAAPEKGPRNDGPAATAVGDIKESLPGMGVMVATAVATAAPEAATQDTYQAPNGKALATPATRKLARELGVELTRVRPSGAAGRVTKDDVRAHVAGRSKAPTPETSTAQELPAPASALAAPRPRVAIPKAQGNGAEVLEERVPFRGVRRKIAERLQYSKNTAAHFTFVEECDCTALKALRERMKPKAEAEGVKLSYLPFIMKAVVASLKRHPILNTALDEASEELVYRKYFNLGIAAATEQGLMVPVVKQADKRSLLELARELDRLSSAARAGKIAVDDLQGSTFTITSLGAQGGLFATPIINMPEVAILGVHQMKQKPVVRDGQIVIGEVMLLSLSFDHRVIDGHIGAAFAYEVIRFLEDPDRLMLEL